MDETETAEPAEGEAAPEAGAESAFETFEQQYDDGGDLLVPPDDDAGEEVEWDGKTFVLKGELKALKPGLMMQADYTRKTQEVAETRKQVEAQAATVQQQAEAARSHVQDYARVAALNGALEPYGGIDWQGWAQRDPASAEAAYTQYEELARAREGVVQSLYAKEQQATHSRQREQAAAIEQGEQVLRNRIKEWSPEYEGKLIEFGVGYGLTADDVRQAKSAPGQIELLHLARIGAESLQQRATVQRHEQAQTTQPAPPVRGGSAPSNRDPSNMDFADFEKWARNREAKAG